MLKKIVVGFLLITVIGGTAFALIDRQSTNPTDVTATMSPTQTAATPSDTVQPLQAAAGSVGDIWSGSGTILDLSSVGMTLALDSGGEIYVELGPQEYWQSQNATLNTGASVRVDGFFNGTNYHARAVTTTNGTVLTLRDEAGQPLWSGGNDNGESGGQGQVQVTADEWVTVEGAVTALTNNGIVITTPDANTMTISFGRADFWQTQETTFSAGDAVSILGFWQGDQFSVGQVTNTSTGERILLRDPNGRPLWAGPGRGQGNGGQGQHVTPSPEATASVGANQ